MICSLRLILTEQRLEVLWPGGRCASEFVVSTSRYGPGERQGSGCTPRGRHVIRAKIGAGLPPRRRAPGAPPHGRGLEPGAGGQASAP